MVWSLPSCFRWIRLCMIGWTIPRGSTRIEYCPEAWNLTQCCFIFLHNTDANMLCRLFDDRKYMDIYLPIPQEYCYLGKQKNSLYFLASASEHLWPSHSLWIVWPMSENSKIIMKVNVSRNHHLSWEALGRLPPYLKEMLRGFVRCNFIDHHGWNGRESTNQLQQHISHMKLSCISSFIVWSRSTLYWSKDNPVFFPDFEWF